MNKMKFCIKISDLHTNRKSFDHFKNYDRNSSNNAYAVNTLSQCPYFAT